MNCPKCNGPIEMGSLFCPNCGAKVDNSVNSGNASSQEAVMINNSLGGNASLSNTGNDGVPVIMNNMGSNDLNTNGTNLNSGIEQDTLNGSDTGINNGGTVSNTSFNGNSVNNMNVDSNVSTGNLVNNNVNTGSLGTTNSGAVGMNYNSNMGNVSNNVGTNSQVNSNVNSTSPIDMGSLNANNVGANPNGINASMNNNVPNQNMNINNNPNVNPNTISKVNKSGNLITIILVLVIAVVAIVVCYLMVSGNKNDTTNKDNDVVATNNTSDVTINGRTGKVPKGWSFISGIEAGSAQYESVFVKNTRDSAAFVSSTNDLTFDDIKNAMYTVKTKFESMGFSELNVTTDKKNGIEYVLFDGLYEGSNYHILYLADGVCVVGSEGYYASSDDLTTIVDFITSLKKNTATKGLVSDNNVSLFNTVIEK